MNRIKDTLLYLFSWIFVASGVISCQQEEEWTAADMGFLVTLNEAVTVATKATPAELDKPVADNFYLSIIKESTGKVIYNGNYSAELVPASAGTYILMATCGEDPILAWDTPYYAGMETTDLADGETKQVDITCRVANALLSVTFNEPELFAQLYDEYGVRVSTSGMSLDISGSRTDQSAYFRAGANVSLLFYARLVDGGSEVTYSLDEAVADIFPLQAGQHAKLTLSSSNTAVQVDKAEVETVTIEETLPLEWLPKPKVESTGFVDNQLNFVETETPQASIRLNMASALQEMKLKFNFQDPQFASLNATEEKPEYLLSNAADKQAIEQTLGITLPSIGDTQAAVDLSSLVARMQSLGNAATVNTIELDVQANNRWSSENAEVNRVYTLTCSQPVFSVEVLPGNIWTKEFTIEEATVNATSLLDKLTYQYRASGADEWINAESLLVQFSDYPENKNYEVRAFLRDGVVSEAVDVKLETPESLTNGGMEEWYWEQIHEDGRWNPFDSNTYTVYPWSSGGTSFWNTNNDFTTRNRSSVSNIYNCFPAVSFVKDAHNGTWAVELRNTGNGRGNTLPSNVLDMNRVAGELFTGDITVSTGGTDAIPSGDNYTITKGRPFSVRPTALKFWYKYVPLNSDTWRVHIELQDVNGNVIIEKTEDSSESQSEWKEVVVSLDYVNSEYYEKCAKIYIYFASTINTGSALQYEKSDYTIWLGVESSFSNIWHGSTLTIDDISLVYGK